MSGQDITFDVEGKPKEEPSDPDGHEVGQVMYQEIGQNRLVLRGRGVEPCPREPISRSFLNN